MRPKQTTPRRRERAGGVARRKTPIEVDLSVIEELADGDSAELAGLIAMFNRHMADGIEQVRAAIETCELASVARVAHTCIGFTLTLGIIALEPTLRKLERASKQGQPKEIARWLAQWEREFEQVRQALVARMNRSGAV